MEQPQYNMLARDKVEGEFAHLYEETGLGLTVFSPLKMGLLTGKYNDGIPADSRLATDKSAFTVGANERVGKAQWNEDIGKCKKLAVVAEKLGVKQSTLALGWVLKNKRVSSAITGASKPAQVYESLGAFEVVDKLTDEVVKEIEEILGNKPAEVVRRFRSGT